MPFVTLAERVIEVDAALAGRAIMNRESCVAPGASLEYAVKMAASACCGLKWMMGSPCALQRGEARGSARQSVRMEYTSVRRIASK